MTYNNVNLVFYYEIQLNCYDLYVLRFGKPNADLYFFAWNRFNYALLSQFKFCEIYLFLVKEKGKFSSILLIFAIETTVK